MLTDKLIGAFLFFSSVLIFVYYTLWVFVLPFVDKSSPIFDFFPDQELAISIPTFLLVFGIFLISTFIGYVLSNESGKRKKN